MPSEQGWFAVVAQVAVFLAFGLGFLIGANELVGNEWQRSKGPLSKATLLLFLAPICGAGHGLWFGFVLVCLMAIPYFVCSIGVQAWRWLNGW